MYNAYRTVKALPYFLWLVVAAIVSFASPWVTSWCPPWIWQIIISIAIFIMWGNLDDVVGPRVRTGWYGATLYRAFFGMMMFLALMVFFNFGRYESIIAMTGEWPLRAVGSLLALAGALVFVFEWRDKDHLPKEQSCAT